MKKRFTIFLIISFTCLTAFAFSGCGLSRFTEYEYRNGIMLFLDGDETNFYAEFDFITSSSMTELTAYGIDAYLLSALKEQYGDLIKPQEKNYYEETDIYGQKTGKTIFYYSYVRKISDEDINYYRYDPKLIALTDYNKKPGFYYNNYSVSYSNPLIYTGVDTPFYNVLKNLSCESFNGSLSAMLACGRRDKIDDGGFVKAADLSYWAQFSTSPADVFIFDGSLGSIDKNTIFNSQSVGYSFNYMVSWSWYLTVLLIAAAVIASVLLIAKKGDGKFVDYKPKVKHRRYPYGHPHNPYGYPPNPYGNNQGDPFGSNNQYPPYGAPPQYPPYGNTYGNSPYGQYQKPNPPQTPKPDDVFPGFGNPGENGKNE